MLKNHDLNHDFCISKAEASMVKSIKRNAFDMSKKFDDYRDHNSLKEIEVRKEELDKKIEIEHNAELENLKEAEKKMMDEIFEEEEDLQKQLAKGFYVTDLVNEKRAKILLPAYREHKDDLRKIIEDEMEILEKLSSTLPCPQTLDDLNKFTNLKRIEKSAFEGCVKIRMLDLEYIEQIDDYAFDDILIKEVKLPSLSKIGENALPHATRNIILTSPNDIIAPKYIISSTNSLYFKDTIFVSLTLNKNKRNEISNNSWRESAWESINLK